MKEISEERANELDAAWKAASDTERLSLPRMSWFAADRVIFYEEQPSPLERTAAARIAALEAENNFVREKINAYVQAGFDPSMMGPTLDDIRHHLKVADSEHSD